MFYSKFLAAELNANEQISYLSFIPIHSFSIYFDTVIQGYLSLIDLVVLKRTGWGAWKASFRKSVLW